MFNPDFWFDGDRAAAVNKRVDSLKSMIDKFEKIEDKVEEIELMLELEESPSEIEKEIFNLEKELDREEVATLMNGEYDKSDAIMHIHSGAGGKDASDWTKMLERLYLRWSSNQGLKSTILDRQEDEGGLKYVTILLEGNYAFGRARCEKGIHRLVRISPFDSNARRHTSFASLSVSPSVEEVNVDVDESDLRIDTFRASGAGGQHVNTTDSAVRITHIPTGITASCSNQRSQIKNRESALKILRSRILELELEKREEEIRKASGEDKSISWGNQIRSYVFHPYKMVKDHRTNLETSDVDSVMDGNIDMFVDSYLRLGVK